MDGSVARHLLLLPSSRLLDGGEVVEGDDAAGARGVGRRVDAVGRRHARQVHAVAHGAGVGEEELVLAQAHVPVG